MPSDPTRLAYWLLKDINKAIRDFEMIQDGDRIGVAVSGGKDSLSLLRLLDWRRKSVPEKYEIIALHIIGDARGPACSMHQPLIEWLQNNSYKYAIEPVIIPEEETLPMNCQRCTHNRRHTLFQLSQQSGCNVVAFGHHADDLAQTTLLNLLFGARPETMAPRRDYFDGELRLIRPMCYTREKDIRRFAHANLDFPPLPPDCPLSEDTRRLRAEELIQEAEVWAKDARKNLLRAGLRGNEIWGNEKSDEVDH
jgi:tRNA 2-thiocytidine biosynthesis protein TtcA